MSLVGSLEDLGLGDILQIVGLSRKSGVLYLRCDGGEGRIVLDQGMVRGAAVKGRFEDLRGLLLGGGHLEEEILDRAEAEAAASGAPLLQTLVRFSGQPLERLEALCRQAVEAAVMDMFEWRSGEFTFEVREALDGTEEALLLSTCVSTQFLAMEATRRCDEFDRFEVDDPEGEDDLPLFSGEVATEPQAVRGPNDLAMATARRAERVTPPEPVASESGPAHLIAIDPDLAGLEWLKNTLQGQFERIHIFQRAEIGVDRIRHYLGRGVVPVVVVSARASGDGIAGVRGAAELITRLRALASSMHIAVLLEQGCTPEPGFEAADAVVFRPPAPGLDPEQWCDYNELADHLRDSLSAFAEGGGRRLAPRAPYPDPSLARLKRVSDRLRDPSTHGEVLSLVMEFASEYFRRVAVFMLRDDRATGMAQRGLEAVGGPCSEDFSRVSIALAEQPEIFRRVVERRRAIRAPLAGEGDRRLAMLLGTTSPRQAYAAPIESGGCAVALLYADNLPTDDPIPDTTALEIVLHEAGMALDRALLQRALDEAGSSV